MSIFFQTKKPPTAINSLIGTNVRIEGKVLFSGGLRVDGAVRGNVSVLPEQPGTLVVGETGRIDGDVASPHLVVHGTINGTVRRCETLEVQSGATVSGDVSYESITVQPGAIVEGRLVNRATIDPRQAGGLKAAFGV